MFLIQLQQESYLLNNSSMYYKITQIAAKELEPLSIMLSSMPTSVLDYVFTLNSKSPKTEHSGQTDAHCSKHK